MNNVKIIYYSFSIWIDFVKKKIEKKMLSGYKYKFLINSVKGWCG